MYYDENYKVGCDEVFAASGSGGIIPDERRYGVKVIISTDGGDVTLCGYDKVQSFEIVSDLTEDDYITFGNASSKQLTLSLVDTAEWRNTDFQPKENQKIQMFLYVDDGITTDPTQITNVMPIGTYYISEVKSTSDKYSQLTITAFDWLSNSIMNSKWKNDWDKNLFPILAPPTINTIDIKRTIITELTKAGIDESKIYFYLASYPSIYFTDFILDDNGKPKENSSFYIYKDYITKGITRRQMIAYLAGLSSCNAYVDFSDRLRIKPLTNSLTEYGVQHGEDYGIVKIYNDNVISYSSTDKPVYPVAANIVTTNPVNNSNYVMSTKEEYWYDDNKSVISGARSIQYFSPFGFNNFGNLPSSSYNVFDDNDQTNIARRTMKYLNDALSFPDGETTKLHRIKPLEIKWRGNPVVELGDVLSYEVDGETFAFPVCHITMNYNGGLTMTLKSYGFNAQSTTDTVENQGGSYNTIMQVASADLFTTQTLTTNVINDNGDNQVLLTKNSYGNTVLGMGRLKDGGQTNIYGSRVNIGSTSSALNSDNHGIRLKVFTNTDFSKSHSVVLYTGVNDVPWFRPDEDNTVMFGHESYRWKALYCNQISTTNFKGSENIAELDINYTYTDSNKKKVNGSGYIRYYADTSGNEVVRPSSNEKIYLGSNNYRWYRVYTKSIYCTDGKFATSDRKAKEDINAIDGSFKDFVMSLKPVTYKLKKGTGKRTHCGFVAQDVSQAAKDTVGDLALYRAETKDGKKYNSSIDDSELEWVLDYEELIAPLTALVQQQQKQIDKLTEEIEKLKQQ
nr:MAG TPA: endosialidase chaperone [Caudoviricetes sp.]